LSRSLEPPPLQCAACGAALPDETPAVCPACGADLTATDSVMLRPTAGSGTRLIAWIALTCIAAMLFLCLWLLLHPVQR
jgi:predicted amidophosphoribosyltransferase